MHIKTVTLHKIVHYARDAEYDKRFLHLSFKQADGTLHEWTVPGWPIVQEGMTVTAILKKPLAGSVPNTVLGWRSHYNGKLAFEPLHPREVVIVVMQFALAWGFALLAEDPENKLLGQGAATALFLSGLWSAWTCAAQYRIGVVLRRLKR